MQTIFPLPDTSGLEPLSLPTSLTSGLRPESRETTDTKAPTPEAIARFRAAMGATTTTCEGVNVDIGLQATDFGIQNPVPANPVEKTIIVDPVIPAKPVTHVEKTSIVDPVIHVKPAIPDVIANLVREYPPIEANRASSGDKGTSTMTPIAAVSSKPDDRRQTTNDAGLRHPVVRSPAAVSTIQTEVAAPAKPVNHVEKTIIVDPVIPAKPVNHVEKTIIVDPVAPVKPVTHVEKTIIVDPVIPAKPVTHVEKTIIVDPVIPVKPVSPEVIANLGREYPPIEASRAGDGDKGTSTMTPVAAVSQKPPYQQTTHRESGLAIAPPVNHVNSANPVEIAVPADSVTPVKPIEKAVPADSVTPVKPIEKAVPANSVTPVKPIEKAVPAASVTPVNPVEKAIPADPVDPVDSPKKAISVKPAKKTLDDTAKSSIVEGMTIPGAIPFPQDAAVAQPTTVTVNIDPSTATARTSELTEAVSEVARVISVTPALTRGDGEVVIHLKQNVLDGSEIRLEAKGSAVTIEIRPANAEVAQAVERTQTQFAQQLSERLPSFQFTIMIATAKPNSDRKSTSNETD